MQDGILFDNLLLTTDPAVARDLSERTFVPRSAEEADARKKLERESAKHSDGNGFVGKTKKVTRGQDSRSLPQTRFGPPEVQLVTSMHCASGDLIPQIEMHPVAEK